MNASVVNMIIDRFDPRKEEYGEFVDATNVIVSNTII